jgi:hypothetical protein
MRLRDRRLFNRGSSLFDIDVKGSQVTTATRARRPRGRAQTTLHGACCSDDKKETSRKSARRYAAFASDSGLRPETEA